jgi:dTDP-4-dehydrorhamnose 3,5-epimerase
MKPAGIEGAWTFTPAIHRDERGCFLEWYRAGELSGELGFWPETAQANCSVSRRGVIRGVHFSSVPPGQAKYVTCVSGAILDVVVDVRVGSPGFGRSHAIDPLDPELGIAWPVDAAPVLSGKDAAAPTLEEARRAGLLPGYADCQAYLAGRRRAAGD